MVQKVLRAAAADTHPVNPLDEEGTWTMFRRLLLVTVLAALVAVFVPTGTAAAAPLCYGTSCDGAYPQDKNCDVGARTLQENWDVGGWVLIALRYSPACNAVWTRIENFRGVDGEAKIIGYFGNTYRGHRETLKAYRGEVTWTKMVSHTYLTYGCYRKYHPMWGPTEWCSRGF